MEEDREAVKVEEASVEVDWEEEVKVAVEAAEVKEGVDWEGEVMVGEAKVVETEEAEVQTEN